jgi:hypothetical protein
VHFSCLIAHSCSHLRVYPCAARHVHTHQLGSEEFSLVSGAYGHSQMEATKKLIDAAESVLVAPYVYRPAGAASVADVLARLAHAANAHAVTFRAHDSVAAIEV